MLTTTSATLILSLAFGADCMTRIDCIYSLPFDSQRQHTLFLIFTFRDGTLSLSLAFWLLAVSPTKMYTFCNLFLSYSVFLVRHLPASNTTSEISSNPKRDKQPAWEKTRSSYNMLIYFCIRGSLNKFPDFFRMGTIIDSTRMKL